MLSCIVTFNGVTGTKCNKNVTESAVVARKLTSEIAPTIISNAYFKPSHKCPYYFVQSSTAEEGTLDIIVDPCNLEDGREIGFKLNLLCGESKAVPVNVFINYLKTPKKIELIEDDLYGDDRTEKVEFPDYVCYEIINEFVKLLLENTADPRLSTNVPINQTVIPPVTD